MQKYKFPLTSAQDLAEKCQKKLQIAFFVWTFVDKCMNTRWKGNGICWKKLYFLCKIFLGVAVMYYLCVDETRKHFDGGSLAALHLLLYPGLGAGRVVYAAVDLVCCARARCRFVATLARGADSDARRLLPRAGHGADGAC
jgi:hypothetical protein